MSQNAPAKVQSAISPVREENFPEWYQEVIKAAELAENSEVRGCMVIKPWGYGIWEHIQRQLDRMFKDIVEFAEVGQGNMNWPALLPAAEKAGADFFFIEQDDTYGRDPFDCIADSRAYLASIGY